MIPTILGEVIKDLTIWVYAAKFVICAIGFALFLWWWLRQRTASEVFAYITFLLLSASIEQFISLGLRVIMYYDIEQARAIVISPFWSLRTAPSTFVYSLIVIRMGCRAYRSVRLERRYRLMGDLMCEGDPHDVSDD